MSQNEFYTDHSNVTLEVTFKTAEVYEGLKCFLLRTYSEQYDSCNAHALIHCHNTNRIKINGKRVELTNYDLFKDHDGQVWKVEDYRENSPPETPGFIFRLKALQKKDIEPDLYNSSYGNDPYEDVDWGNPSTFNQAAWDNIPDRD